MWFVQVSGVLPIFIAFSYRPDTKGYRLSGCDGQTYIKQASGTNNFKRTIGPFEINHTSTKLVITVNESGYYNNKYRSAGEKLENYNYDQHGTLIYLYTIHKDGWFSTNLTVRVALSRILLFHNH